MTRAFRNSDLIVNGVAAADLDFSKFDTSQEMDLWAEATFAAYDIKRGRHIGFALSDIFDEKFTDNYMRRHAVLVIKESRAGVSKHGDTDLLRRMDCFLRHPNGSHNASDLAFDAYCASIGLYEPLPASI